MKFIQKYTILEILIPFLLIYTIFFALLQKTKIFGDPTKINNVRIINTIIALSIASVVVFFTPFGISLIDFFSKVFTVSLIMSLGLGMFIVFTVMIAIGRGETPKPSILSIVLGVLIVIFILNATNIFSIPRGPTTSSDLLVIGGIIGVITVAVWLIGFRK